MCKTSGWRRFWQHCWHYADNTEKRPILCQNGVPMYPRILDHFNEYKCCYCQQTKWNMVPYDR